MGDDDLQGVLSCRSPVDDHLHRTEAGTRKTYGIRVIRITPWSPSGWRLRGPAGWGRALEDEGVFDRMP